LQILVSAAQWRPSGSADVAAAAEAALHAVYAPLAPTSLADEALDVAVLVAELAHPHFPPWPAPGVTLLRPCASSLSPNGESTVSVGVEIDRDTVQLPVLGAWIDALPPFRVACVGGTFDHLHVGHRVREEYTESCPGGKSLCGAVCHPLFSQ
jgi:hypothetical protein